MTSGDVASLKTAGSIPAAATKDVIGDSCAAGRYGIVVTDETTGDELKLCPLCPAGTYGDGDGCTACAAGTYSGIVGTDAACTSNCPAGEYAPEGKAACQLAACKCGSGCMGEVPQLYLLHTSQQLLALLSPAEMQVALHASPALPAPSRTARARASARSGK